jgi:Xaa-Pro aminopeptidase
MACKISDEIFKNLIENINQFKTEKEMERFILNAILKRGVKPSFAPVIGTGKNASIPHNRPSIERLKGFTVIDFGVNYKGYCSDFTRTIYFGNPSGKEIRDYDLVKRVQKKALGLIKVGEFYYDLDRKVRNEMGPYKKFFIHPLGHGIGKKVHLYPKITSIFDSKLPLSIIKKLKKEKIKEGDSFTIEPGIYKKNSFGIRIEDTVIIKDKKVINLNLTTKKLLVFARLNSKQKKF